MKCCVCGLPINALKGGFVEVRYVPKRRKHRNTYDRTLFSIHKNCVKEMQP